MNLSVFYEHILQAHDQSGKSIPEILQFVHSLGISAVEMDYAIFSDQQKEIRTLLSDAGLCISCFYDFFDFPGNDDLSRAKELLETAAELKTSKVLLVPGSLEIQEAAELSACSDTYENVSVFMENNPATKRIQCALTSLATYAAPLNVTVTLEDFDGFTQPFARMNQLLWFMKNVPGLRFTLDMGNFAFSDEDVSLAAKLLKDYIVHVHCKDRALNRFVHGNFCKGLEQSPAGSGYLPIQALITSLKEQGYDSYLAIEHFGMPESADLHPKICCFPKKMCKHGFGKP